MMRVFCRPVRDLISVLFGQATDARGRVESNRCFANNCCIGKQCCKRCLGRSIPSPRILEAEGLGVVVISKGFRKASPGHDCAQRLLRRVGRHVVFELIEKPASWCDVIGAFLQHTPDMGGKRNEAVNDFNFQPWLPTGTQAERSFRFSIPKSFILFQVTSSRAAWAGAGFHQSTPAGRGAADRGSA